MGFLRCDRMAFYLNSILVVITWHKAWKRVTVLTNVSNGSLDRVATTIPLIFSEIAFAATSDNGLMRQFT
jgi:hypothetical protein